jgi:hypothetical protein
MQYALDESSQGQSPFSKQQFSQRKEQPRRPIPEKIWLLWGFRLLIVIFATFGKTFPNTLRKFAIFPLQVNWATGKFLLGFYLLTGFAYYPSLNSAIRMLVRVFPPGFREMVNTIDHGCTRNWGRASKWQPAIPVEASLSIGPWWGMKPTGVQKKWC